MRILFFIESFKSGGKERRLLELIHYLQQNTDYVMSLVITEEDIQYDEVFRYGIEIKIIKRKSLRKDPLLFREFYKYCLEFSPDIIHTWGFMNTFYAVPVRIFLGIPLISSMISVARKGFRIYSTDRMFFRISCHFSDVIISNSEAGLKAFGIKDRKARVIYNGVRMERFQKNFDRIKTRAGLGINTTFMIIMVANISKFKDYDLFLDVAREIQNYRSDVTFLSAGDGILKEHISDRITNEGIVNVVLAGKQKNIEPLIAASDIGLLCTISEGISNAVIEYMALGKPVIVTDINGGSKELVVEGETGFCVERNAAKVADLITRLLDDPEMRKSMGEKGAERIRTHFSLEKMGEEFVSLYKTFI
ncbi:MAG TPA: hypothetical protein DDW27_03895 [Bacteroidales bacterium]|nr:hypothetical protein [Bacteroidales bacterium]